MLSLAWRCGSCSGVGRSPGGDFAVWVCAHASSFLTIVVLNSIMGHLALFRGLTRVLWDHPAPGAGTRGARGERI